MLQTPPPPSSEARGRRRAAGAGQNRIQGRGGIQKRRGTPTRIDKDGDLDMDSGEKVRTSGSGAGRGASIRGAAQARRRNTPDSLRGRPSTRPGKTGLDTTAVQRAVLSGMSVGEAPGRRVSSRLSRAREADSSLKDDLEVVKIWGLKQSKASSNPDGGLRDLVAFLERKANHPNALPVRILQPRFERDAVVIKVHKELVPRILHLNEFQFAAATLRIESAAAGRKQTEGDRDGDSPKTIDVLKNLLTRRYNGEAKLLDLSGLGSDPDLNKMGMFNSNSTESKFFPALMKVCDENFANADEKEKAITSVSLANNKLSDIRSVTTLAQSLPAIRNLDLSMNQIPNLGALESWRWKFRKLDHLILAGNPIEMNEPQHKNEIMKWYPTLRMLNNEQVRTVAEASAATKNNLPIPILGPHFRDEASIGENFVKNFFPAYDSDRAALANAYYDAESKFSLSINTSAPRDEGQQAAPWDQYIKKSRNLTKLDHISAKISRLFVGSETIAGIFSILPVTRHPHFLAEPQKWCIECHTIPGLPDTTGQSSGGVGGLIVITHGEFQEIDVSTGQAKHLRSFDRTFVLGPGAGPGGIRVASDVLTLRAYGGCGAWRPEQDLQNQGSGSAPAAADEQARKETTAVELSKATGMTFEYAAMCLEQSGWNLEIAAANFEQAKANLPPEAFITA